MEHYFFKVLYIKELITENSVYSQVLKSFGFYPKLQGINHMFVEKEYFPRVHLIYPNTKS